MTEDRKLPDEYVAPSGQTIQIWQDKEGKYQVACWDEDGTAHWVMDGVVIEDTGTRQVRRQFTREEAFAEFDRWRT